MKFSDLLGMSIGNLFRRKVRTLLTIFGVLIGTASVVTMVSIGIGMKNLNLDLQKSSVITKMIEVHSQADYGASDSSSLEKFINDKDIAKMAAIKNVDVATPYFEVSVILKQGVYVSDAQIIGVTRAFLEKMPLSQGTIPQKGSSELELLAGGELNLNFYNPKVSQYATYGNAPDIDFMNKTMFIIYDTGAYYSSQQPSDAALPSQGGGDPLESKVVLPPKKYIVKTSGIIEADESGYSPFSSYGAYADIDILKAQLRNYMKNKVVPGQPETKKGKPYKTFVYSRALVMADDQSHVEEIQNTIKKMGFQTDSILEIIKQQQKQSNLIQTALGMIGGVSLFVAAIGIANTMMMSIYERTKEIGIMKVLGCDMAKIRDMFLIESALIGFIGGVVGVGLSYFVAFILNSTNVGYTLTHQNGNISIIPNWMGLVAVVFAIMVGMVAGLLPSLRAMKLSPLSALRNE